MKSSSGTSAGCARSSWPTRSWKITPSRSLVELILALLLVPSLFAAAEIAPVSTRDRKISKKWSISGSPRGVAVGADGTVYVGLAETQSIVAVNPDTGKIIREVVLDRAEIAATKEIVTLRITADGKSIIAANGSDESVTILSLPNLQVTREIGMEGETIRDAVPDPAGKYLYILGRELHVYDANGATQLRTITEPAPMAIATDRSGKLLAVIGSEKFSNGDATVVALFDTATFKEIDREPLQTDRKVLAATFSASDTAIVVAAEDWFAEKRVKSSGSRGFTNDAGKMRIKFAFGDLISSQKICLPKNAGAQILAQGRQPNSVIFAERRCSAGETFTASEKLVTTHSIYGVNATALAVDSKRKLVYITDPKGFLVAYHAP